jgi:hypothetical protein
MRFVIKVLSALFLILFNITGCDVNATVRLVNSGKESFDRFYQSGIITSGIEQYLQDGLVFHVYSPNDIPIDRYKDFLNLVVWVTATQNNINKINIISCKITSDSIVNEELIINEKKEIVLEETKLGNIVFFRGYANLLNGNNAKEILEKINIPYAEKNNKLTAELTVEYMKDNKNIKFKIFNTFVMKIYKSFTFWDKMMSV